MKLYKIFDVENDVLNLSQIFEIGEINEHKYGALPVRPMHLNIEPVGTDENAAFKYLLSAECEGGNVVFPFYASFPKSTPKTRGVILHLSCGDKFEGSEDATKSGFALFTVYCRDVCSDDGNFKSANAKLLCPSRRYKDAPGKLAIWAWAIMRVIDYAVTRYDVNKEELYAVGDGILNDAVLFAALHDKRIKHVLKAQVSKTATLISKGSYLFSPSFKYTDKNDTPT